MYIQMSTDVFDQLILYRDPERLPGIVNDLEIELTRHRHFSFVFRKTYRVGNGGGCIQPNLCAIGKLQGIMFARAGGKRIVSQATGSLTGIIYQLSVND